jgi:hypothetical protein
MVPKIATVPFREFVRLEGTMPAGIHPKIFGTASAKREILARKAVSPKKSETPNRGGPYTMTWA